MTELLLGTIGQEIAAGFTDVRHVLRDTVLPWNKDWSTSGGPATVSAPAGARVARHVSAQPGPVPAARLRAAMGRFATGVALVTTRRDDEDLAVTVNSLTCVSLAPPLVLVCLRRPSSFREAVVAAGVWAVSILAHGHLDEARHFGAARPRDGGARLRQVSHRRGAASGCLAVDGALAVVECATWTVSEAGDHTIVVGQVCSCAPAVDAAGPLIFFGGGYGSIAPPPGVHAAGAPAGALTT